MAYRLKLADVSGISLGLIETSKNNLLVKFTYRIPAKDSLSLCSLASVSSFSLGSYNLFRNLVTFWS